MDTHPTKPRVVIAGGSGFLGSNLAAHLVESGYEIVTLARSPKPDPRWTADKWDASTPGDWVRHLEGARAIVNLAGRSVDCIKSPANKEEILRSRVDSTLALAKALVQIDSPPPVWVQMSTAHIYGDPPATQVCDESTPVIPGRGNTFEFAPTVGRAWEQAFDDAAPDGMRKVIVRTSFVLGKSAGALPRLAFLARVGLGGTVGSGSQGISWIHEQDMNRLFLRAIEDESMRGTYVATAPNPVSNKVFMRELRRVMRMPVGLPAPAFLVRIGAPLVMRTDPELALLGRYCVSERLEDESFTFNYPALPEALADLYA